LKFYGRIWFIDPLLGYGFNFYNTDLYLRAIEVEMTDVVDEFDAIGAIFLQKRYFEEESKANWWCNALTSDECEETRRPKYKNRSRYFDQHAEIGHYKNFISAMK
jgi:hypothetical protein